MAWTQTFFSNGVILGSGLVSGVLAARFLGVEGRGALAAVTYWPHFIAGFAAFGINESIAIQVGRDGMSARIATSAIALSLGLAVASFAVLLFLIPVLLGPGRAEYVGLTLVYAAIFMPATFLAQNLLAITQGKLEFGRFNRQRVLQSIIYPLLIVAFLAAGIFNLTTAAIAMLAGTVLIAVLRVWNFRAELRTPPSLAEAGAIVKAGVQLHFANQAMFMSTQLDKMLLIFLSDNVGLGLYVVAMTIASAGVGIFVQTYVNIALPQTARQGPLHENRRKFLLQLLVLGALLTAVVMAATVILPLLMPLLFGPEYNGAIPLAQVLVAAFAIAGLRKAMVYLMRARGYNRDGIIAEATTAALILSLGYFALEQYGVFGLSIAVLLANGLGTAIMAALFSRAVCGTRV